MHWFNMGIVGMSGKKKCAERCNGVWRSKKNKIDLHLPYRSCEAGLTKTKGGPILLQFCPVCQRERGKKMRSWSVMVCREGDEVEEKLWQKGSARSVYVVG